MRHTNAPEAGVQKVSEMVLSSDFVLKSSERAKLLDFLKHRWHRVITHGHTKAIEARWINLDGFLKMNASLLTLDSDFAVKQIRFLENTIIIE